MLEFLHTIHADTPEFWGWWEIAGWVILIGVLIYGLGFKSTLKIDRCPESYEPNTVTIIFNITRKFWFELLGSVAFVFVFFVLPHVIINHLK